MKFDKNFRIESINQLERIFLQKIEFLRSHQLDLMIYQLYLSTVTT